MRSRLAIILLAAFVALTITAGPRLFLRGPGPQALRGPEKAAKIEVRRAREDVLLERKNGVWRVPRHDDLADSESVALLLGQLAALEHGRPVAKASEAGAYGLGPADAIAVTVHDEGGQKGFEARFGRRALSRSAYFRASERDGVRIAEGIDSDLLRRLASEWREPRLLPGGCPGGLEVSIGKEWREAPAETAGALCSLRAAGFADGADPELAGLDKPLLRVRARDGRAFAVGDRRGSDRLVAVEGRSVLLRVPAAPLEAAAYLLRSIP